MILCGKPLDFRCHKKFFMPSFSKGYPTLFKSRSQPSLPRFGRCELPFFPPQISHLAYLVMARFLIMKNWTQELIIGGLLLATLAILVANQLIERTVTYDQRSVSEFSCVDDSVEGGHSKTSVDLTDGVFKMAYNVDPDSHANPFAKLKIEHRKRSDEDKYRDLSWVDSFELELRCSKPGGEHFLFIVRNFEAGVTQEKDFTSRKYNVSLINATNEMSVVKVKRDEFVVPTWWKILYEVKPESAYPSFKNTEWLELSTQGDVGSGSLEVKSIKCSGHWLNTETLNQTLLWLWLGGTLVGSLYRMLGLKKKLNEKTASAMELLEHNNLLMSESATYHELARRDPLTGLLNRYGLEGKFEELTAATGGFSYTMILFDLDNFKQINDTHGHCYGDRVLFNIARIANSKIGKSDIVARWGGDEFLIILFDQNLVEAAEFTEEIRQAVLSSDLQYTCSFGISKSEANIAFEETLRNADTALYESKEDGRNTTNVFRSRKQDAEVDSKKMADDNVPVVILPTLEAPAVDFTIYE